MAYLKAGQRRLDPVSSLPPSRFAAAGGASLRAGAARAASLVNKSFAECILRCNKKVKIFVSHSDNYGREVTVAMNTWKILKEEKKAGQARLLVLETTPRPPVNAHSFMTVQQKKKKNIRTKGDKVLDTRAVNLQNRA